VDAYELDRQLDAGDPLAGPSAAPKEVPAIAEGENVLTANQTRKTRRHGGALPH
jgi:hypothetical protein